MVSKKDGVAWLAGVPLFSGFTQRQLARLWDRFRIVEHRDGDVIVTEGRSGVGFHLVLSGEVRVVRSGRNVVLGRGQFFGEMSVIDDAPRSATIVAVGDVATASLTTWDFRSIVENDPKVAWALLVHMTGRLREEQSVLAESIA